MFPSVGKLGKIFVKNISLHKPQNIDYTCINLEEVGCPLILTTCYENASLASTQKNNTLSLSSWFVSNAQDKYLSHMEINRLK